MGAKPSSTSSQPVVDRLLAGAAELFRTKGYAATTTRELSALVGLQNASLYYHMERKEDLLFRLCANTLTDLRAAVEGPTIERDEPVARLKEIVHAYATTALRDRDRIATMLIEMRSLTPERRTQIVEMRDANVAVVREAIAAAQQRGQIRTDIAAKHLSLLLFNLVNWAIFWFQPDGELSPDDLAELMLRVFLEGCETGPRKAREA